MDSINSVREIDHISNKNRIRKPRKSVKQNDCTHIKEMSTVNRKPLHRRCKRAIGRSIEINQTKVMENNLLKRQKTNQFDVSNSAVNVEEFLPNFGRPAKRKKFHSAKELLAPSTVEIVEPRRDLTQFDESNSLPASSSVEMVEPRHDLTQFVESNSLPVSSSVEMVEPRRDSTQFDESNSSVNAEESSEDIPLYNSMDSIHDDIEDDQQQLKVKKEKVTIQWAIDRIFPNQAELNQFFKEEPCWGYHFKNDPIEGRKVYYRCKLNKARSEPCASRICIMYASTSDNILLFRNGADHTHGDKPVGIEERVKSEIQKMLAMHVKPGTMLLNIAKSGLPVPDITQVRNYIAILKRQKYGAATVSLGELTAWLQNNSQIPVDEFEPFVLAYNVWGTELDDKDHGFRFFITSKSLLLQSTKGHAMHSDSTYKLVWQGFPILIAGKSDMNQSFHPSGLSVSIEEKEEDFAFIFEAIKDGVRKIHGIDLKPSALIADAAGAIRNGFRSVFGDDGVVIMCWYHMKKAVVLKVKELCDKKNRVPIVEDINKLQLSPSVEIFQKALKCFLEKWQSREGDFIEYFKHEWVDLNPNWYEGILKWTPTTNNTNESFNNVIKSHHTFRERKSLAHFLTTAMSCVRDWSIQYKQNIKTFAVETKIDLPLWTSSYQWAKLNKTVKCTQNGALMHYRIPAFNETVPVDTSFNTFDEFKINAFRSYDAFIDKSNWRDSTCSCPFFLKHFLCKHILGVLLRTKVLNAPPEAKNIPIGEKRKRGRPSKARKALIVQ